MATRDLDAGFAAGIPIATKTTFAPSGAPPPLTLGAGHQLPSGASRHENEATWLFENLNQKGGPRFAANVIARLDRATQYSRALTFSCAVRLLDTRFRGMTVNSE